MHRRTGVLLAAGLQLAACQDEGAGQPPASAAQPSIYAVMTQRIVPGSDALWNAVGETFEGDDLVVFAPSTPEQWNALAQSVASMKEGFVGLQGANVVAAAGESIQDEGLAGSPPAAEIQERLNADAVGFQTEVASSITVLDQLEATIVARDVDSFTALGEDLSAACESCHQKFWYPDQEIIP